MLLILFNSIISFAQNTQYGMKDFFLGDIYNEELVDVMIGGSQFKGARFKTTLMEHKGILTIAITNGSKKIFDISFQSEYGLSSNTTFVDMNFLKSHYEKKYKITFKKVYGSFDDAYFDKLGNNYEESSDEGVNYIISVSDFKGSFVVTFTDLKLLEEDIESNSKRKLYDL